MKTAITKENPGQSCRSEPTGSLCSFYPGLMEAASSIYLIKPEDLSVRQPSYSPYFQLGSSPDIMNTEYQLKSESKAVFVLEDGGISAEGLPRTLKERRITHSVVDNLGIPSSPEYGPTHHCLTIVFLAYDAIVENRPTVLR